MGTGHAHPQSWHLGPKSTVLYPFKCAYLSLEAKLKGRRHHYHQNNCYHDEQHNYSSGEKEPRDRIEGFVAHWSAAPQLSPSLHYK